MRKIFIIIFIFLFICAIFSGCFEEGNNGNNTNNNGQIDDGEKNNESIGYDDYSFYKWCAENQNLIVSYIVQINNNINESDWNTVKYWCKAIEDKIDNLSIRINYFFLSDSFNNWSKERYNETFIDRFKDVLYSYKLFAHNLDFYCDEILSGNIDDKYYYDKSKDYLSEASESSWLVIGQMEIILFP